MIVSRTRRHTQASARRNERAVAMDILLAKARAILSC